MKIKSTVVGHNTAAKEVSIVFNMVDGKAYRVLLNPDEAAQLSAWIDDALTMLALEQEFS